MSGSPRWSVAIFAARESIETLTNCLHAAMKALEHKDAVIDVLVNGNKELAASAALRFSTLEKRDTTHPLIRLWYIPFGDKAHAWNEYIHHIWQPADVTYFVDGYAEVRADAFALLHVQLQKVESALGATGVPTSGRSAQALRNAMLAHGGIHGNLHAIRGTVIEQLRKINFRMPLGLYRTDGLIGAVLMFDLDPRKNEWNTKRIEVTPEATWDVRGSTNVGVKEITAQLKRKLRQAQGDLENHAIRELFAIQKRHPSELPNNVCELVGNWITTQPRTSRKLFLAKPLILYAARKLAHARDWSESKRPAQVLFESR